MIDDLEALVAGGVVSAGDVDETLELALAVVAQEGQGLDDGGWRDVERELVLPYGELLYEFGQALHEV